MAKMLYENKCYINCQSRTLKNDFVNYPLKNGKVIPRTVTLDDVQQESEALYHRNQVKLYTDKPEIRESLNKSLTEIEVDVCV